MIQLLSSKYICLEILRIMDWPNRSNYQRIRKSLKYKILHDKKNSEDIIENINQARVVYDFKSHVDYGGKLILI